MSYVYARITDLASSGERSITHAPVEALRAAMREWRAKPENATLSQKEVGRHLHVSQQTYSKFEAGSSGASYFTATHIARLAGFEGVDAFFMDRGVSVPGQKRVWADRFPRREMAAYEMIRSGQITPEAYDMVRDDPEYNMPSANVRWSLLAIGQS